MKSDDPGQARFRADDDDREPGRDPRPGPARRPPTGPEIYPDVRGAFTLTFMAIIATLFVSVSFGGLGALTAYGIGQAVGIGAVASLAAGRVLEPQSDRIGLRPLDLQALPMLLCLVPAVLLQSELDNWAFDLTAPPAIESVQTDEALEFGEYAEDVPTDADPTPTEDEPLRLVDPDDLFSVLQAVVVWVGIAPVVSEFLFRGVIQQGLVERLGMLRGVSLVAFLWMLLQPAMVSSLGRFVAFSAATLALGWLLGIVRIATGSILAPILLAASWGAVRLVAGVYEGRLELPGMNIEGTHLPFLITLASIVLVAWAARAFYEEALGRIDLGIGAPPPSESDPSSDADWPSD